MSKGATFERKICVALSRWVSGKERDDLFWRSAMSGGRATVHKKAGKLLHKHAGDIVATDPLGEELTGYYFVELKHYRDLELHRFWWGEGMLAKFWKKAAEEAKDYDKEPLLIAKQNRVPTLVLSYASASMAGHHKIARWYSSRPGIRYPKVIAVGLFDDMIKLPFASFL